MKKNTDFPERLSQILEELNITPNDFGKKIGYERSQTIYDVKNGKSLPSFDFFSRFVNAGYSEIIDIDWLITGKGEMLRNSRKFESLPPQSLDGDKNLIPLYSDVVSIGGSSDMSADMGATSQPVEYIDTGDWFRGASAAIRHYGNSMVEYPSGCILALKEICERHLVVWGEDHVIETSEYRITKCVQRGQDSEHIMAYSSNTETYPDGKLKHEPLEIAWEDIRKMFLVLGYVVKKNGGTMVYSNNK